jgi:hypothetical protein
MMLPAGNILRDSTHAEHLDRGETTTCARGDERKERLPGWMLVGETEGQIRRARGGLEPSIRALTEARRGVDCELLPLTTNY